MERLKATETTPLEGTSRMTVLFYYTGRALQLLGMWLLLIAVVTAGPLGPSPRVFGVGIAVFVAGWFIVKKQSKE